MPWAASSAHPLGGRIARQEKSTDFSTRNTVSESIWYHNERTVDNETRVVGGMVAAPEYLFATKFVLKCEAILPSHGGL